MFEDHVGQILSKTVPPQGMTSVVTLLTSERGRFVVKRADRPPFVDWLKREAHVLKTLQTTNLPVPRCVAFDEHPDSATMLMTALPGEPLTEVLCRGVADDVRRDLLEQFGRRLMAIHRSTPPIVLHTGRLWLDRILDTAQVNVERGYAEPKAPQLQICVCRVRRLWPKY